jgi:hypothetical protein
LSSTGISHRIDPFLGASLTRPPLELDPDAMPLVSMAEGDARIRWEGQLLTTNGPQTMHIRTDSSVRLTIDGHVVIEGCKPSPETRVLTGTAQLAAGWHDARMVLDSARRNGRGGAALGATPWARPPRDVPGGAPTDRLCFLSRPEESAAKPSPKDSRPRDPGARPA